MTASSSVVRRTTVHGCAALVAALVLSYTSATAATPDDVGVALGLVHGRGHIGESQARVQDLAGPGTAIEARLGWRRSKRWIAGTYAGHSWLARGIDVDDGSALRTVSAGLFGELHAGSRRALDPWLRLSSGWRVLWLEPATGKSTSYHAWELVCLQAGIDRKLSTSLYLAPVLAIAMTSFVAQDSPQAGALHRLHDRGASIFLFAGVQARFGGR